MKNKKGLTVLELMMMIAIMGIILAIAIPNMLVALEKGRFNAMRETGEIMDGFVLINATFVSKGFANLPEPYDKNCYNGYAYLVGAEKVQLQAGDKIQVVMRKKGPRYNLVSFWKKL